MYLSLEKEFLLELCFGFEPLSLFLLLPEASKSASSRG